MWQPKNSWNRENILPVLQNPLLPLNEENLVVVAVSYSLRMTSAVLTSLTRPDLFVNFFSNNELKACKLILVAI